MPSGHTTDPRICLSFDLANTILSTSIVAVKYNRNI